MQKKKAALAKKAPVKKSAATQDDPKKAAIEAAMKRAAEKKAKLAQEGVAPKNTEQLNAAQQRQIDQANARRGEPSEAGTTDAKTGGET
jgi:hypothetical protein